MVDPDLVFIVSYSCPRCHASLEAQSNGPPTWLRCPSCGRASLPPEHNRIAPPPYVDDRTLLIGNFTTGAAIAPPPFAPRTVVRLPPRPGPPTPTARLLLGSGFFLTTALFVFSLLDSNGGARRGLRLRRGDLPDPAGQAVGPSSTGLNR